MSPEDRNFARIAIKRKLVTKDQVKTCLKLQAKMVDLGVEPKSLHELLIEKEFLDEQQARKVAKRAKKEPPVREIANFRIIKRISQGSMGTVYKARQKLIDRIVALKILSDKLANDREFKNRFIREARAVGMLKHPNIIQGIDVGEAEGRMYFAMEFVDGNTVHELLHHSGPMDEEQALEILRQVTLALKHAHKNGLVHRDIKPDNIMVAKTGEAKLCDLGLVKHPGDSNETQEGRSLGTPNYISPEQARGEEGVDIRSDLYSLGASLYHMLTGAVPFRGPPALVMTKHINEPLPDPTVINDQISRPTVNVIRKLSAKDPDDRYQTPSDLLCDIEAIQSGEDPFGSKPIINRVDESSVVEARKRSGSSRRLRPSSGRRRRRRRR